MYCTVHSKNQRAWEKYWGPGGGVIRLEYNVKSYAMNIGHGGHLVSRILRDFSELSSTLSQEMKRM